MMSILSITSFSFQLSGALILILWSIGSCDKKIKLMCLEQNSGPLWFGINDTTTLDKDSLQSNAKMVYKNIFELFDIAFGYICEIFVEEPELKRICIFGIVIVITLGIILVENWLTNLIARKKYSKDIEIALSDIELKTGQMIMKVEDIE